MRPAFAVSATFCECDILCFCLVSAFRLSCMTLPSSPSLESIATCKSILNHLTKGWSPVDRTRSKSLLPRPTSIASASARQRVRISSRERSVSCRTPKIYVSSRHEASHCVCVRARFVLRICVYICSQQIVKDSIFPVIRLVVNAVEIDLQYAQFPGQIKSSMDFSRVWVITAFIVTRHIRIHV